MIVVLTELGYNGAVCQCDQFRIDLLDSSSKKRGVLDTWCTGDKGISAPLLTSICYERKAKFVHIINHEAGRSAQSRFDANNFKVLQQYELRMAGLPWDLYQAAIFTASRNLLRLQAWASSRLDLNISCHQP